MLCILITAGMVPAQPAEPTTLTTSEPITEPITEPPAEPNRDPVSEPSDATDPDAPLNEAVVTLHSGRQITGFLIESTADSIVIRINGIDTTFSRARIAAVRVLPPVEERFRQLRDAVDDDDIRARMALVEWLRIRRAYELALVELEGILAIEPNNSNARTIHAWIKAHLALNKDTRPERSTTPNAARPQTPQIPVLTARDINRIRIYEIDLRTSTRLTVPEETMRTLMVRSPEAFPVDVKEREKILQADPIEQLRILFELRARDLYDTVTVREDPPVMQTFKSRVHGSGGWLVNACASNRCHGGTEAGRLRLINKRPNSDETAYTNFYILQQFRLADGTPLLNYEEPARSPLLHLGLTRQASLYPHPEVDARSLNQDWRQVFRSTNDRRFRETADWVASLYQPRPDYRIQYPPAQDAPPTETSSETTPEQAPEEPPTNP